MSKTRNERHERAKEAIWVAGVIALLALAFLSGMASAIALGAAAW